MSQDLIVRVKHGNGTIIVVKDTDIWFSFDNRYYNVTISPSGKRMLVKETISEKVTTEVTDACYELQSSQGSYQVRETGWLCMNDRDLWVCTEDGELVRKTACTDL